MSTILVTSLTESSVAVAMSMSAIGVVNLTVRGTMVTRVVGTVSVYAARLLSAN